MGLTLIAGPANAGKVALLLERYLTALPEDPTLIVPNRSDVERVERDLLRRGGCLLGGSIGTFDDVFERLARGNGSRRPVVTDAQRALLLRRTVACAPLGVYGPSSRFGGFADALGTALAEMGSGLLRPEELEGELAALYRVYLGELDRVGLWDRDLERGYAASRVADDLEAWNGSPVFAYGFEDLTGAQWALLEALAGRVPVTVSLPYEPGRPAFDSLSRTSADLAGLAAGAVEELPAASERYAAPALAHLERALFADTPAAPPALGGAIRFFEGAGARGVLELVALEVLRLLRRGTSAEEIAIVCPSLERSRAPLETALLSAEVPFAVEGQLRVGQTPFGHALLSLLRFAWLGGGRRDLYAFLRSPYSGLTRPHADYLEGRIRGRGVEVPERVEAETLRLRGQPLPFLDRLRSAATALSGVAELVRSMLRGAYGLEAPPVSESSRLDLRAYEAVTRLVAELEGWEQLDRPLAAEEVVGAVERASVRLAAPGEPGCVAVTDLLRVRTRRFEVVFILGLEEGSLPRRGDPSPFLDETTRQALDSRRTRLARPDQTARERYLFYTACTRAVSRLYLVREAASDEGSPREASPFWDEVRGLFDPTEVARATRRRALSALTWPVEEAPSERERLRGLASLARSEPPTAAAIALANGWERRLERAQRAFERPTRLTHPLVLEELRAKGTFGVTELEAFADCSSIWFLERVIDPKTIDPQVDARLRGSIAHTTLNRFYSGLPKRLGADRIEPARLDGALAFLRECLEDAMNGIRLEIPQLDRHELEQSLRRDLEQFLRDEVERESPLHPRRFEVSFGSDRSAPELQRGLDLGDFALAGKIDRIDVDPFSARGIVQDYKSGKTAHSAAKIDEELRLQIPLYMLVLRDLVGIEPLGGVYRALAGERQARGLLRAEARADGVPGFVSSDYLSEDEFWAQIELARERARMLVGRIREGDIRHDPRGGPPCPPWCDLYSMCRVRRA